MAKEDVKLLITADGQKAVRELQEVTKHMGGLGKGMSDFLGTATGFLSWQTAAVAGIGALAAGMGAMISKAINTADEFANMSKRTGLATESLSKLAYAAKMSDTSSEILQKSLKFLNVALYDVGAGNKTTIDKFKEFGVEVKNADGSVKNAEEALFSVADAFVKLESEAAKTKLATELFGKTGQELMPMLAEGGAGIRALANEAINLGLVVDTELAESAERFNDSLEKLKLTTSGIGLQFATEFIPVMNSVSSAIDSGAQSGLNFGGIIKFLGIELLNLLPPLSAAINTFKMMELISPDPPEKWHITGGTKIRPGLLGSIKIPNTVGSFTAGSGGSSRGGGKEQDVEVARERYVNLFEQQEQVLAMLAQQYAPEAETIWRSFFSFPDELVTTATSEVDPLSYLADYQKQAIDMWVKYYNDLEKMGTTNFILMSQTTQDLFGGMSEAMSGFGNLMSSQAGKTEQDYRAMFEIGKAFKSAEIVTSTYSAAVKAYESQVGIPVVGPYLAVAAAASAVAFGTAQLANLWSSQPGQSSINGGGIAPTPNFQQRNPQGGTGSGDNRTIVIRYEGLIYGDKDKIARDLYDAFAKAGRDGMGR